MKRHAALGSTIGTGHEIPVSRMLIRLYLGSVQAFDAAGRILHACFIGVWLAVLGKRSLDELNDSFYCRARAYLSEARTLAGLMQWEEAAIDKHFGRCSSLIVTGAGSGREVIALHKRGYDVDGFECNDTLRSSGNDLLSRIGIQSLQPMNRDECPAVDREYDESSLVGAPTCTSRGESAGSHSSKGCAAVFRPGRRCLCRSFAGNHRPRKGSTSQSPRLSPIS